MTSCPPWLSTVNNAPWNIHAQPVYDRVVQIHRLKTVAGVSDTIGAVGYAGAEQGNTSEGETVLLTGVFASIQLGSAGRATTNVGLPGDAVQKPVWKIYIPASSVLKFSIRDRDVILDDEGYRYEVSANMWTASGYELSTIRLEA